MRKNKKRKNDFIVKRSFIEALDSLCDITSKTKRNYLYRAHQSKEINRKIYQIISIFSPITKNNN